MQINKSFVKNFQLIIKNRSANHQQSIIETIIDYFNETAGCHSEQLGFPLKLLFTKGYSWVLLSWNIEIDQLPRNGDKLNIETWISHTKRCFVFREFLVKSNDTNIIIRASSQWVFYNINKKMPVRILYELANKWIINSRKACPSATNKFILIENSSFNKIDAKRIAVKSDDIDFLDHVHNSKYINWIFSSKPKTILHNYILKKLEIYYLHEIKYPGDVFIKQQSVLLESNKNAVIDDYIWDQQKERIATRARSYWNKKREK